MHECGSVLRPVQITNASFEEFANIRACSHATRTVLHGTCDVGTHKAVYPCPASDPVALLHKSLLTVHCMLLKSTTSGHNERARKLREASSVTSLTTCKKPCNNMEEKLSSAECLRVQSSLPHACNKSCTAEKANMHYMLC